MSADEKTIYAIACELAKQDGCDDPNELLWDVGTIPEPRGEVWQEYEERAKAIAQAIWESTPEWLLIKTAPRDGTNFLAYNERQPTLFFQAWWSEANGYFRATGGQELFQFTHWMPLPEPPK